MTQYKRGGGNKPQPYIPAGNGSRSGEYTSNENTLLNQANCNIKYVQRRYNYRKSRLVRKVSSVYLLEKGEKLPVMFESNSVIIKVVTGYVVTERYYNERGYVYLDIDYTCHGNPITHPVVPHVHRWLRNCNGKLSRQDWEAFK